MARILIGNIKGPQGPTGPRGATGPQGPAGPQGPLPPLTNNFLATVAGQSALDAVAGKTLKDQLDKQNSDLALKANSSEFALKETGFTYLNGASGTSLFAKRTGRVVSVTLKNIKCTANSEIAQATTSGVLSNTWMQYDPEIEIRGSKIYSKVASVAYKTITYIDSNTP